MDKCIAIGSSNPAPGEIAHPYDYKCLVCGSISPTEEGCCNHIHNRHRELVGEVTRKSS